MDAHTIVFEQSTVPVSSAQISKYKAFKFVVTMYNGMNQVRHIAMCRPDCMMTPFTAS